MAFSHFHIGPHPLGPGNPCFIIAEVAQNHDGSLGQAHAFIDAVASTGVHAIKFQTHFASEESSSEEPWRIKFSLQDKTRFDYWKRMEFTEEQWRGLQKHAKEKGLIFLSSPFSLKAIHLLEKMNIPVWKVGSGEISTSPMLESLMTTKKPILISTGMSDWKEIDSVYTMMEQKKVPIALLQCTSVYPTPAEKVGLNVIDFLKKKYQCPVGLSDHSAKIYTCFAAAAHGIHLLEVHVTLSQDMFGPDVTSSLTIQELTQVVEGIRWIEKIELHPVEKDQMAQELKEVKSIFSKSLVASCDLPASTILQKQHFQFKKPGTGLSASSLNEVIGRKLIRDIKQNHFFKEEDFEPIIKNSVLERKTK